MNPSVAPTRTPSGATSRKFAFWVVVVLVAVTIIVAVVPSARHCTLRQLGWALVAQNTVPKSADVIVISTDAEYPGALFAADLVHRGVADRVEIFPYAEPWEAEYRRRAVDFQSLDGLTARYTKKMGVPNVEVIAEPVTGSENEGDVLPGWCDRHGFMSVAIITTPDHSRRLARILRRAMKDHHTTFTVVSTPYSSFDPDRWWQSRGGIRTEIEESEKLLLDVIRHPFS